MIFEIHPLELVTRFAQWLIQRNIPQQTLVRSGRRLDADRIRFEDIHWIRHGRERRGHRRGSRPHDRGARTGKPGGNRLEQPLERNGLFKEIDCTDARGLDSRVNGGVAAHHDHRHIQQALRAPLLEKRHAIGVGHPDVEQHQIGPSA